MNAIRKLFEEDIELQDSIEDLDDLVDDTDDAIIDVIEAAYADDGTHLFTEAEEDEELAANAAIISLSDEEMDDIVDAENDDDIIDAALGDDAED